MTKTMVTVMGVAAAMFAGCVGAPLEDADMAVEGVNVAPSCNLLPAHPFTGSGITPWLDALNVTVPVSGAFTLALDTAPGNCFFNANLAGDGVRASGTFHVTSPIALHGNLAGSVVADGAGVDPYEYRVRVHVGDVTFASDGDVVMSTNCLSLNRPLVGTVHALDIDVDLAAPKPSRSHFVVRRVTPSFGTVTVVNPDALIPSFTPVCNAINTQLASASVRAMISDAIVAAMGGASAVSGLATLADLGFASETGFGSSNTICSDTLSTCSGVACGSVKYD